MRNPWRYALIAAAVAASGPVEAQDASLRGTYVLDRERSANINQAIETTIRRMSFVARPIARSRLRRTNAYYDRVVIDFTPVRVTTQFDGRHVIESPAGGETIKWTREDGEVLDLSTRWQGGRLVQSFTADDGGRVNTYSVGEDGRTLTMHVVVSSPRLPRALEYDLVYTRAGQ